MYGEHTHTRTHARTLYSHSNGHIVSLALLLLSILTHEPIGLNIAIGLGLFYVVNYEQRNTQSSDHYGGEFSGDELPIV